MSAGSPLKATARLPSVVAFYVGVWHKSGTKKKMWELLENLMSIKDYILKSDFKEQINLAKAFECAMNLAFTKKKSKS